MKFWCRSGNIKYRSWIAVAGALGLLFTAGAGEMVAAERTGPAATITVYSAEDVISPDGRCVLREALANANSNTALYTDCVAGSGMDQIRLNYSGILTLTRELPEITDSVIIAGGIAGDVQISGNERYRIFKIRENVTVELDNLVLKDGMSSAEPGGAIYNNGGHLTLDTVYLYNNAAPHGGALAQPAGSLEIRNSTFWLNRATAIDGIGGALALDPAGAGATSVATATNSTFSNNLAPVAGGAIYSTDALTLVNATLTRNSVYPTGIGGALATTVPLTLPASAVAVSSTEGRLWIQNSIVAGNSQGTAPNFANSDCAGDIISLGYNLVGRKTGCPDDGPGDRMNNDPHLGPLALYGGPLPTHAPFVGSPVVDVISDTVSGCGLTPLNVDQRRVPRPRDDDGDGIPACEIGAYEGRWISSQLLLPVLLRQ